MRFACLLASLLLAACGGSSDVDGGADGGVDFGFDAGPQTCADTTTTFALPTPQWDTGATLAPPAGDAAYASLMATEPSWAGELAVLDGWPARTTFVVPLDGPATGVDPTHIELRVRGAAATAGEPVDARIVGADMRTLIVEPRGGIGDASRDMVLVVRRGAVQGAHPLPACAAGSMRMPDPAYATAAATFGDASDIELALPYRRATTAGWLRAVETWAHTDHALVVDSSAAAALGSFGAASPDTATAASLHDPAVSGVLSLPEYRGAGGVMLGTDAHAVVRGTTQPAFVAVLPATGTAPYPYVLYQHGGGQSPTDVFGLAKPLADAGFAFVAIDLPEHGHRAPASGGGDTAFLDFISLLTTRGNFQQAVADHIAVLEGTAALNTAIESATGVAGALDHDHAYLMGMSLGGISTSMTFAVSRTARATASFVGGAGYPEIVSSGIFSAFLTSVVRKPEPERSALLAFGEVLLDGADPYAYAQRGEDTGMPPRDALFVVAIGDPVVPALGSDQWARAFGASLAMPRDHAFAGLPEVGLPVQGTLTWPRAPGSGTRIYVQAAAHELSGTDKHEKLIRQPWAQDLVAHCFETNRTTGHCEAIDTGWALH